MKNLKLNNLAQQNLSNKEMNAVRGGECTCGCGCLYAGSGGSSTSANANANKSGGKFSEENYLIFCDDGWYDCDGAPPASDCY